MARCLALCCIAFCAALLADAQNYYRDEIAVILERLNSHSDAGKVYRSADLIYGEFKASGCVIHC